jgi:outer membrane protein TolC
MNTTMRRVVHASVWTCLTLSLLLAAADAAAQAPSKVVTLEEALQLAESRSEQMTIAKAGVDRADADLTRARSDLFPQLSAAASYDRALASEFEGLFDDAASDGDSGEFGDFEDLPFGRKNTFRFNLSFSQNLFSGGRVGAQTAIADAGRSTADPSLVSGRKPTGIRAAARAGGARQPAADDHPFACEPRHRDAAPETVARDSRE